MSIRTRVLQSLAKAIQPFIKTELYSPGSLISGFSYPGEDQNPWSNYDEEAFERLGVTSPLVKPNIDFIANGVARAILSIEQSKDFATDTWEKVINHPFDLMLNKSPMPQMGATFAWKYQMTWLLLRGEAYWMIVPNGFKELNMFIPIPAYMIKPIPWKTHHGGEPRLIAYFSYTPNDPHYPERLEVNQVCFHKLPNPFNPIRGLSPLSTYLMILQLATQAEKFDLDDYVHGLTLSKIISLRADLSDRDFIKALSDWKQAKMEDARYRIFRGGDVSVQDLTTRRGEDGKSVHERARYYAERVWGIPEGLRDKNATEASAKVADEVYQRETLKPLLDLISEDLNAQVVNPYYGENFRVVFKPDTKDDIDNVVKETELRRKPKTYNEVREEESLEPHPDERIGNAPFVSVTEAVKIIYQSEYAKVVDVNKDVKLDEEKEIELDEKGEPIKAVLKPKGKPLNQLSEEEIAELAQKEIEDYVNEFNQRNPQLDGMLEANVNGKNGKEN
jgi:hypothetical protein